MQRSAGLGKTKNQATRPIFVVWIILDDLAILNCLTYLDDADMSQDSAVNGMFCEFVLVSQHLFADIIHYTHVHQYTAVVKQIPKIV